MVLQPWFTDTFHLWTSCYRPPDPIHNDHPALLHMQSSSDGLPGPLHTQSSSHGPPPALNTRNSSHNPPAQLHLQSSSHGPPVPLQIWFSCTILQAQSTSPSPQMVLQPHSIKGPPAMAFQSKSTYSLPVMVFHPYPTKGPPVPHHTWPLATVLWPHYTQ